MKWNEVFSHTFKELRKTIEPKVRQEVNFIMPSMPMVEACRADAFDFFEPWMEIGRISAEGMRRACERYYLGKSRSGKPIFWMIDDMMEPLDAHIGDGWVSQMLKKREPLLEYWRVKHCLFGLHLLSCHTDQKPVCVVESEASAVVLSEIFPESIWMAYATTSHLTPELFAPLEGQTVILYPRTDPTQSTYLFFHDLVDQTRRLYDLDLSVDITLEDNATEDQKEREIDLVDFLLEYSAIIHPE